MMEISFVSLPTLPFSLWWPPVQSYAIELAVVCTHAGETDDSQSYVLGHAYQRQCGISRRNMGVGAKNGTVEF